jgi:NTE family protein
MRNGKRIGVCLSGGGYRATIYHLGTLRKLHELGILKDVDVISTISGGSITGAYFGLYGQNFEAFEKGLMAAVQANVIKAVALSPRFLVSASLVLAVFIFLCGLLFTSFAWVSTIGIIVLLVLFYRFQFTLFPLSEIVASIYDKHFFGGKKLKDLATSPIIAINATNIETGRPFTFSRDKMSDSTYEFRPDNSPSIRFIPDGFPISLAIAASTCVPFAFTPIEIKPEHFENMADAKRVFPRLVDGGVYDNQGIHKLTQKGSSYECDYIIVSDAGNLMPHRSGFHNTLTLLMRTGDLFMNRIKNMQQTLHVFENHRFNKKQIAYQSLGWDASNSIRGFMDNLKKGAILESVYVAHKITKEEIMIGDWPIIQQKLEQNCKLSKILASAPTMDELNTARSVKTGLSPLTALQANCLVKQASCITETQVRLFCPDLI